MNTLVLTGYDEKFAPIGDITSPIIEDYAYKHRFDYECMREPYGEYHYGKYHPSWWKMHFLLDLLKQYERVIWIDADILVTNPEIVPPGESGYHCSLDWGVDANEPHYLSNGCFAAFPDSIDLIRWVIDNKDNYSQLFHEQEHMRAAASSQFKDVITVHPRRMFNAVPIEIHESAVEPWRPGDWIAHLTMVDLKERVRLAKKMIAELKL